MRTALAVLLWLSAARADTTAIRIATQPRSAGNVEWVMPQPKRPKVALVLSGGGARGFAHLGVLKAWEELKLPLDLLVGSSIGGTLGGLYATGLSADSLAQIARNTSWEDMLSNRPPRRNLLLSRRHEKDEAMMELRFDGWKPRIPSAITSGQKLSHFLADLTRAADYESKGDFDRLKIPLRVVATDIVTGERVVIKNGNLADALRSTVAVPLAFTPWEQGGRLLADGGLLDPIPVDVARDLGMDIVVAVNVTSPLLPREQLSEPMALANQATSIMVWERQHEQLSHADYVVQPALDSLGNLDFGRIDSSIALGYEAALPVLEKIRERLEMPAADAAADSSWQVTASLPDTMTWIAPGASVNRASLELEVEERMSAGNYRDLGVVVIANSRDAVLQWQFQTLPPVESTRVTGNSLLSDSQVARLVRPLSEESLSGETLKSVTDSLEHAYRHAGYPLVSADSVWLDSAGILTISINENPVAKVRVEGQKRTRPSFILANLSDLEGKPLSGRALSQGVNSLYATGLFRSVSARALQTSAGPEIALKVEEQDFTRLRFGAHWHEEFRAEAFAELADVNVFGLGHQAAIMGMYGDRRQHVEVRASADRLLNTDLTYSLRGYFRNEEWRLYVLGTELPYTLRFRRLGGRASVGQQLRRFGLLSVGLRVEDVDDFIEPGLRDTDWRLRTLSIGAELDTYDRFPIPRSGYRQKVVLERAFEQLGGNTDFTKFWFELEGVLPLGHEHVAILGGAAGTSNAWLPEPERYVLGGRSTFFGLHYGEGRGDYFWRTHAALRMHNGGRRYITVQYNVGNIWTHEAHVEFFDVVHGAGLAYTMDSPVGPLDLGAGLATDRSVNWYLNLGLPF